MCAPTAPTPPDPQETAGAQTAQNISTAVAQQHMNNMNQVTPDGSLTYDQTGSKTITDPNTGDTYDLPTYTATQTLSQAQQAIHDKNKEASLNLATLGANQSGRLDDLLSRPMNTDGLPDRGNPGAVRPPDLDRVGSGPNLRGEIGNAGDVTRSYGADFSEDRQRVEDTLMERMNPSLDRSKEQLEARLASQGIRLGSEAYRAAMDDHGRQANDARMAAILGAGQEHSRLTELEAGRAQFENTAQAQTFQQMLASGGFENEAMQQAYQNQLNSTQTNNQSELQEFNADMARSGAQDANRSSALQEDFAIRNQPINEITALMSGSQVQNPNFVNGNPAQLANTDYAGIINNNFNQKMQNYQAKTSMWNSIVGGLGGLGGAYIGAM